MKQPIIANAQYWLAFLDNQSEEGLIDERDLRGVARALEAAMTVSAAWPLTAALAVALHPHMERRGYWSEWEDFLTGLTLRARQKEDRVSEFTLLLRRGAIQRQRGRAQAAIQSYRRVWWLCRTGDPLGLARAFSNLGDLYRQQGRFPRAVILLHKALALFETLGDTVGLARTENHLGLVYLDQQCWSEALLHLTRSQASLQHVGDQHGLAKTLQNLGVLHQSMGELDLALENLRQAIHLYHTLGDEIHAARALLNVGNVHLSRADLLQAELAYSQAETLLKHAGDSLDLARARHNLGIVYARLKNWTEAEACFERALEHWRSRENPWNLANTLGEFAALHLAQGNWSKTKACLDEAWQLVGERPEAHFNSVQRELIERRQALRRLTGLESDTGGMRPDEDSASTPPA